jgi:hypothetical protein
MLSSTILKAMRGKKLRTLNALRPVILLIVLLFLSIPTIAPAFDTADNYLFANGSVIYDEVGHPVRLTGIAWFGFETQNQAYHGLWSAKYGGRSRHRGRPGVQPVANSIVRPTG